MGSYDFLEFFCLMWPCGGESEEAIRLLLNCTEQLFPRTEISNGIANVGRRIVAYLQDDQTPPQPKFGVDQDNIQRLSIALDCFDRAGRLKPDTNIQTKITDFFEKREDTHKLPGRSVTLSPQKTGRDSHDEGKDSGDESD